MSTTLPFSPPTALAPLEGIGGPAMLASWAEVGGMGLLCAPFLRVSAAPPRRAMAERITHRYGPMAQSAQLLGTDPAALASAARDLVSRGATLLDLNFGCPSRMVTRKGAGAAMLAFPDRIEAIVRAVREAVDIPLSAKIRLGLDAPDEVFAIAHAVERGGADLLTIHARTLADRYIGPARWPWLRRAVESVDLPVIGNGDVWVAEDALRMEEETGCDAVMVGRGALRNPWIFHQIEAVRRGTPVAWPSLTTIHAFLRGFFTRLKAEVTNERARVNRLKEVVSHLGWFIDDDGLWRTSVLRSPDLTTTLLHLDQLIERPALRVAKGRPRRPGPSPP